MALQSLLIRSYVKMIQHGICTLEQLPDEYKSQVKEALKNTDKKNTPIAIEIADPSIEKYGALHIPNIENYKVAVTDHSITMQLFTKDIFNKNMLNDNPYPSNIKFGVERIEDIYGKFTIIESVDVANQSNGCTVTINGITKDITSNDPVVRIDMHITSDEYEEMHLTIYTIAE